MTINKIHPTIPPAIEAIAIVMNNAPIWAPPLCTYKEKLEGEPAALARKMDLVSGLFWKAEKMEAQMPPQIPERPKSPRQPRESTIDAWFTNFSKILL